MARVTVEDCLARIPNRFALTVLASRRARMLSEDRGQPMVDCDNKNGVVALREIADGRVRYDKDVEGVMREFIEEQRRQLRVTTGETTFLEAASLRALEDDEEAEVEEEVDEVIEELPSDPEALHKKVKPTTGDGDDEVEDDATPDTDVADVDPEAAEEEGEFVDEEADFADDLPGDEIPEEIGEDEEVADEEED